jgi:Spy/CpxP family protein refolding chaperone
MENKLIKIVAVLTVVGLMAAGPVVYAKSAEDDTAGGKGYKQGEGKGFMKELNLTPEQKEKLKAQREAKKESSKASREQMKVKMQALHEAVAKPGTTRADVNGLVDEVNALKTQAFSRKIDGLFAMKEILTPEQFAKMRAQYKEWMDKQRKGRGDKGPGPEQD